METLAHQSARRGTKRLDARCGVVVACGLLAVVLATGTARGDDLSRGTPPARFVESRAPQAAQFPPPGPFDLRQRLELLEQHFQRLDAENRLLRQQLRPEASPAFPASVIHPPIEDAAARAGWPAAAPASAILANNHAASASASKTYEIGKQTAFTSSWQNGLHFRTEDQAFRVHVGGRLHNDFIWWNAADPVQYAAGGVGTLRDGADYRRARIRVNGTMYDTLNWVMEYGFESGLPVFFDTYGELPHLPYIGAVRIGHFREPFSMDALTSGNETTFMERSLIQDAFVPFRNVGLMAHRNLADESMTVAIGGFRANSNTVGSDADDGTYALTSRVTWNPWYEMDGVYAMHLGAAFSTRAPPRLNSAGTAVGSGGLRRLQFKTRPEIRVNSPSFANTGVFQAEHLDLLGVEFGLGSGPLLIQAEYVWAMVDDPSNANGSADSGLFQGFYAQTSWFLTGENRPYDRRGGVFGEARPLENFFCVAPCSGNPRPLIGRGAWEAAIRYSWIDLNDGPVQGGRLSDVTFGLNWYLSRNARFMWNYVLVDRDAANPASSGWAGAFASRFQIDF
jgi:phosphate-selective porin OprO/OprP